MNMSHALVWFRQDLRLKDNPALYYAAKEYENITLLYILDENLQWPMGGASRWWLHYSLAALQEELTKKGLKIILKKGNPFDILQNICKKVDAVFWNRCYEPDVIARDSRIKKNVNRK